jgi:hypothetical protein
MDGNGRRRRQLPVRKDAAFFQLELRTMTGDLEDRSVLPSDVTNARWQSLPFFYRLFTAWVGMGFRNPEIAIHGVLHA